jgi:hypothetical protein
MVKPEISIAKNGKRFCSNVMDILNDVKSSIPDITDAQICGFAGIHSQTLARWRVLGKSDLRSVEQLQSAVIAHQQANFIDLSKVSDFELKKECGRRSWDRVINATANFGGC